MLNLIKGLFFGDEKGIVQSAVEAADKFVQTPDEKSKHIENTLEKYTPFKKAQRLFMLVCVPPYVFCWILAFTLSFFMDVENQNVYLEGRMGDIVLMIAVFYFGGGAAEGLIGKFSKKKD
jgi:hypothetical protein